MPDDDRVLKPTGAPEVERAAQGHDAEGDAWQRFLQPTDSAAFLDGWLRIALNRIPGARAGVLFLRGEGGVFGIAASHGVTPDLQEAIQALAGKLSRRPEPLIELAPGGGALAGCPIENDGEVQALVIVSLSGRDPATLGVVLRDLYWVAGWIDARLWRGRAALRNRQVATARLALDLLAAVDEHPKFKGAALALVNAVPRLTGFDRAGLGMVRGRRIRLEALSDSATFERRAETVREIEAAMDEAFAQETAIVFPPAGEGGHIDLAHRRLAERLGAGAILTVPLTVRGKGVGVLWLERGRDGDDPVSVDRDAVEQSRLAAAAVAPVLLLKLEARRWVSGRLRDFAGRAATAILGRRPALALLALAMVALLVASLTVTVPLRVSGEATLEGIEQRAAVSVIDGFVAESPVKAGDRVRAGDLLVMLDDRDLRLELERAEAASTRAEQALRSALSEGDRAAAAQASAGLAEARAAQELARAQLDRLSIRAPIDGIIVSGDLSQRLGAPVARGEILFEIARLDAYRVRIDLSEYDLAPVRTGQRGTLVLNALPGRPVGFVLRAVSSVSAPADAENRFRLEGQITDLPQGVRPGMEGIAHIDTGPAPLAWTWFRGTVRRVQLFLWRWFP